jgi:biotin operon repressor
MVGMSQSVLSFHPGACYCCWDSTITITPEGIERCEPCLERGKATPATEKLTEYVFMLKERNIDIDPRVLNTARAIVTATSDKPISGHTLQALLRESPRMIKECVEVLRSDWVLPIGSTRKLGYYWMLTEKDFLDWSRPYRGQAITSLATLYRMQRVNFPNLAGQGSLQFVEQIRTELEETIR